MLTILQPKPLPGEHLAEKVIDGGVTNPITLFMLVLVLAAVAFIATVALVAIPAYLKIRRDARDDEKQKQAFRREELADKKVIEESRAQQAAAIAQAASAHRDAAAFHERTTTASQRVLELSEKHLDRLSEVTEQRKGKADGE